MPLDSDEFTSYPGAVLVHPASPPADLVKELGDMSAERAIHAAHACLKNMAWEHLRAMSQAGFDIAKAHELNARADGTAAVHITESLLYRCVRIHLYDELPARMQALIDLGADPETKSGQGVWLRGLLARFSKDLPPKVTRAAFEILLRHGVRMGDPCADPGCLNMDAIPVHQMIAQSCPELAAWAKSIHEAQQLGQIAPAKADRTRLRL